MDKNHQCALNLWVRYVLGNKLTSDEKTALRSTMDADEEFRKELFADESLHRLLAVSDRVEKSEDQFVQAVLEKCSQNPEKQTGNHPVALPATNGNGISGHHRLPTITAGTYRRNNGVSGPKSTNKKTREPIYLVASLLLVLFLGSIGATIFFTAFSDDKIEFIVPVKNKFATITAEPNAVWKDAPEENKKLPHGSHELLAGEVDLTLGSGARIHIDGPAFFKLVSHNEVFLARGRLSATVPLRAKGFSLVTPAVRVIDLGTRFDVFVKDTGSTNVRVVQGRVKLNPSTSKKTGGKCWHLEAEGLSTAQVLRRIGPLPTNLITLKAQGEDDEFLGVIKVNEKSLELKSPEVFDSVHVGVLKTFEQSPYKLAKKWQQFLHSFGAATPLQGTIKNNNRQAEFTRLDGMLAMHNRMVKEKQNPDFKSAISINGKMLVFNTLKDFQKAKEQILTAFENLEFDLFSAVKTGNPPKVDVPEPKKQPQKKPMAQKKHAAAGNFVMILNGPERTWISSGGAYRLKATLLGITKDGQFVRLRREDGNEISVLVSRLSDADQQFIHRLQNPKRE